MLTDKDNVTIAKLKWDDVTYEVKFVYGRYHLITNDKSVREINRSIHDTIEAVYEAIDWFNDCVRARLLADCKHFFTAKGQKEFRLSNSTKSPTQELIVADVDDVDGSSYKVKMVESGWELYEHGANFSVGRYMHIQGVFNNLRGRCSDAAYKAAVAQYKQLKSRFDFEPYIPTEA